MGTKTTDSQESGTSQSSTTVGQAGEIETGIQELLAGLAGNVGGQIGDLSNLTSGNVMELSPEVQGNIQNLYNTQAQASRRQLGADYQQQVFDTQDYLAKRGFQDSSEESTQFGALGAQHQRNLADVEGQRIGGISQANLSLPFQIGQQQIGAQNSLFGGLQGLTGSLLNNFLQRSLGERSTTGSSTGTGSQQTSGFTLGELAGFMPSIG